jgi:glycosyltransferase involved in cell wall biosynthesis
MNPAAGIIFSDLGEMVENLSRAFSLDRRRIRERAVARFGVDRMVREYVAVYERILESRRS